MVSNYILYLYVYIHASCLSQYLQSYKNVCKRNVHPNIMIFLEIIYCQIHKLFPHFLKDKRCVIIILQIYGKPFHINTVRGHFICLAINNVDCYIIHFYNYPAQALDGIDICLYELNHTNLYYLSLKLKT